MLINWINIKQQTKCAISTQWNNTQQYKGNTNACYNMDITSSERRQTQKITY